MTAADKRALLLVARHAIESSLYGSERTSSTQPTSAKDDRRGCFVTLRTKSGALRGCIGTIAGGDPLVESVAALAREAAFADPRFRPLTAREWPAIITEVSVLTEPTPVEGYRSIEVGVDGVILTLGLNRAVFLPQVAREQGWDLDQMLTHLSMKAGLAPDAYRNPHCRFEIFQAEVFSDEDQL
ncbi:MAG: AmmeMemoRadiSam system protein A [Sphaerochaeta sp.]|nr:AmmeMemoRadiSam system protein A [Sphaerochaeta sp.]